MMISFVPLYMERVWGGRRLASLYGRSLPKEGVPYGESWEIVDRPDEQSVVAHGPYAGQTLHDLWTKHREEIFGPESLSHPAERFPILVKILDAVDTLSIQVHPPASKAAELNGEPKTEMWFVTHAEADSALYVGVKLGTSREAFGQAIANGTVEQKVHRLPVWSGQFMFIPSGRLHAIGAGLVIFEIQQNSDTTYRVFDWNRVGLDGKPRDLHIDESLRCIDFTDIAPKLGRAEESGVLVKCEHFITRRAFLSHDKEWKISSACIIAVVDGSLSDAEGEKWGPGAFFLAPQASVGASLTPDPAMGAHFLYVTLPETRSA